MHRMILTLFLSLAASPVCVAQSSRPVFIKTTCDGKISSAVLSALKSEIGRSQKYRMVHTLDDDGQMDNVFTINLKCTENTNSVAIALIFGEAKCLGDKNCHLAIDASSLHSELCESEAPAECGRALFKTFDEYASNPLSPHLRLN